MQKSKAPWSHEEVANLKKRQTIGIMHEYTCGCGRSLIPTIEGWKCVCKPGVIQNWAEQADADGRFIEFANDIKNKFEGLK